MGRRGRHSHWHKIRGTACHVPCSSGRGIVPASYVIKMEAPYCEPAGSDRRCRSSLAREVVSSPLPYDELLARELAGVRAADGPASDDHPPLRALLKEALITPMGK